MFVRSLMCAALAATLSPIALPQQGNIRSVTFFTIKGGEVGNYLSAVKELNAVLKKAGSTNYSSTWRAESGPREFALVRYHQKFAEMDQAPGSDPKLKDVASQLTAISMRINNTIESSRRTIEVIDPEMSLPMTPEPPAMVSVLRSRVRPDRLNDYLAAFKSDLWPAVKKSGIKVYMSSRTRFGGSSYEITRVSGVDNYAQLDGESPIIKAMGGRAAYDAFLAKIRPMTVSSEYQLYRFMKDQSYLPPSQGGTSNGN